MNQLEVFRSVYRSKQGKLFAGACTREGLHQDLLDAQIAAVVAPGPFYYFVFDCHLLESIYAHATVTDFYGVDPGKFTIATFLQQIHRDDIRHLMACESAAGALMLRSVAKEDLMHYQVTYCYRIRHQDGGYRLVLHQGLACSLDANGLVSKTLLVITDISHITMENNYLLSLIGMNARPSYIDLDPQHEGIFVAGEKALFSDREKEILRLMAQGLSAKEIGERLFISYNTVRTHKQNMLRKALVKNSTELLTKAIRMQML